MVELELLNVEFVCKGIKGIKEFSKNGNSRLESLFSMDEKPN
jgi:hypothetical protein